MRNFIKLGILLTIIIPAKGILAQEKTTGLDPVTITTTLTPQNTSKTGRDLVILSGDKFADLPVHSLDELLKYLPGVEIQSRGPMGAQSDIVLRGATFQQVLVILDGIRLNDPNTGHFTGYIPIAPAEIDRIEILKGASSAIYGSEAVGGVIYIFTKSFGIKKGVEKLNANAQITSGQYGLFSVNAGAFYSSGNTALGGGILSNNTYGQPQRGINGYLHNNTGSLSVSHYFSEHLQLSFRSSYDDRNFAAQNFYTNFVSDTATERVKTFWNQLQLKYNSGANSINFNLGYKNLEDHYLFNTGLAANQNTSNLLQSEITDQLNISSKTSLVTGLQFIDKKITSNDRGNHKVDQSAIFIILNKQFGQNFFISPAFRLEWNEISGWQLVPQLNVAYHKEKYQLRLSAGKTTRDADFTELYNNYNKSFVSGGSLGNPDLKPERSFSYEAGADYFAGTGLKLSATFFQRHQSNLIDYVNTAYADIPRKSNLSPTGKYALAENIADVTTTGIEADFLYTALIGREQKLWSTLGFTWLQSTSSQNIISFYLASHAKYLVNFNVNYANNWFSVSFNGIYKNRHPLVASAFIAPVSSDYFVMNSKIEGIVIKRKLSLFAEADNLFNLSYSDLLGAQMPGRWLMAGLKISLSK